MAEYSCAHAIRKMKNENIVVAIEVVNAGIVGKERVGCNKILTHIQQLILMSIMI
jgi:hypothetical protein